MSDPLFDGSERPPQAARLAPKLHPLAKRGVYFGTSSWKYDGWLGSIYSPDRYITRNKLSKRKFEDTCIREYAETFPAVVGDFSFYQFPSPETWKKVFEGTPPGFVFGLKVPEAVTVARWPTHPRYGKHAGLDNTEFLSTDLFKEAFLVPLEPHKEHVGVCIFEFGTFAKKITARRITSLFRWVGNGVRPADTGRR